MRQNKFSLVFIFTLFIATLSAFDTADQLLPTKLKITVLDGLGNPTKGAVVTLYKNEDDYFNNENAVEKAKTDEKGLVVFKKLEPISYYIDARKGDMNNDGEGVKIAPLQEGRTNKVNTVIE